MSIIETIAKLALSPLLVAQGLQARKSAARLPEPPGHRSGQQGHGPDLRLLIVGDSSAAGVGASHQSEALSGQLVAALSPSYQVKWRLVARTGSTTKTTIPLLNAQDVTQADVALVVLGVNDVTSQIPLPRLLNLREALYDKLAGEWGAKRIIATGVPPIGDFPLLPQPLRWVLGQQASRFDIALARQAQKLGVDYLHFDLPLTPEMMAEDGFHPGPNTYHIMGQTVAQHILHR